MIFKHYSDVPEDIWKWKNFPPDEFRLSCPCCGEFYLDKRYMDSLQAVRDILGKPVRLNSGHRCPIHNAMVGGAPLSEHKRIAFDISIIGHDRSELFQACKEAGFRSFGGYQTFLHTDMRPGRRWFGDAKARELWIGVL